MARGEDSAEEKARRGVGRILRGFTLIIVILGVLGAWSATGFYTLDPGEAAVILQLGRHVRTETAEGLHFHLPVPVETRDVVEIGTVKREQFGDVDAEGEARSETAMQTSDNNIVHLEFVVRYRIGNPFESRYRVADLNAMLRDGAQAAMREVVGRNTIDGVLSDERGAVQAEATERLQQILEDYETGLYVQSVELQEVQPPKPVREAFDDVIAANQDRNRTINEAEGYANEVLPRSRAEARELIERASAFRQAKVADATGEAERFSALVVEYQRAPQVTRRRLYLETMEQVLPKVDKVIIEPGTASVLPYLPLDRGGRPATGGGQP